MTITTDLLEIDIVLLHYVSFEWWYEAREYIPSKDQKLSRFKDIIDCVRKGPSKGGWTVHADRESKWNFCSNEGIFSRKKKDFIRESF
ncbi:LOW QUALITY PROTEIN: hypothetical protein V1477_001347 [Vespula maculifrons]|uniref:Uncharacterized protein n=1 Tax=Vespula maculifrons TaxID=7453 RepID=A0ABD2CZ46_VESMC